MTKLFSGNEHNQELTISHEMIDYQNNDYVVQAITECFDNIIEFHNKIKPMDSYKFFESRDGLALFQKLDMIISKRFGISFKHAATTISAYGAYTVPPKNFNVLYKNIETDYSNTASYLKYFKLNKDNTLPKEEINNADLNYDDLLMNWKKSIDSLEKSLGKDGVHVDLRKARIMGLPDDYVVFLVVDICALIDTLKLDSEEMTAVLLHEIGHAFTHVEYSYRTIANTAVLIDTIHENVNKYNKTFKESILIAYKRMYNEVPTGLEKANLLTVTIATVERFFKESVGFNPSGHAHTDSEQLADQFAGRFNMGAPLATGLSKIYKIYGDSITNLLTVIEATVFLEIFAFSFIAAGLSAAALPIAGIFTLIIFIIYTTESYLAAGGLTNAKTYDENSIRLTRIKNELVRKLRSSDFNKEITESILTQVSLIETIINNTPDIKPSFINGLMQKYTAKGKQLTELTKIEQLTESLMENDLHVAAARLNTIAN